MVFYRLYIEFYLSVILDALSINKRPKGEERETQRGTVGKRDRWGRPSEVGARETQIGGDPWGKRVDK